MIVDTQFKKYGGSGREESLASSSHAARSIAFAMKYISPAVFRSILMVGSVSALAPPHKLPKLVLLDRDGVINEDAGSPGVIFKSQFRLTHRVPSKDTGAE